VAFPEMMVYRSRMQPVAGVVILSTNNSIIWTCKLLQGAEFP
jgi:hypothetical protein